MKNLFVLIIIAAGLLFSANGTVAQERDFLTADEVELIRDAQEIDRRIDVLVHAADRRFEAMKIDVGSVPIRQKDEWKWGPMPTGERVQLFGDIRRLLQKAIDDIDNLAEHPDAAILPTPDDKKAKPLAEIFPIAVRSLAAAAARYRPALTKELDTVPAGRERSLISASIDMCDEIIASVDKLPKETPGTPAKNKKKNR